MSNERSQDHTVHSCLLPSLNTNQENGKGAVSDSKRILSNAMTTNLFWFTKTNFNNENILKWFSPGFSVFLFLSHKNRYENVTNVSNSKVTRLLSKYFSLKYPWSHLYFHNVRKWGMDSFHKDRLIVNSVIVIKLNVVYTWRPINICQFECYPKNLWWLC